MIVKRLQKVGNSHFVHMDKGTLKLLGITPETDLEITVTGDGRGFFIMPRHGASTAALPVAAPPPRLRPDRVRARAAKDAAALAAKATAKAAKAKAISPPIAIPVDPSELLK